ncbi:HK97 gp10 family phage protein [Sphingobium phenoxybenzoativorans]|uniref:HK97 gp10 family phage protein n=2 Tax=Sphingobium phenoxybenzoativorans TaxID=1592790 RepID=A0A975Q0G4_9SPHN|nr:HK97 gp10 family phage protein [Sphingobium phenoxybenzoativorans]
MPDAMHRELEDVLDQGGADIQKAMIARTPRRTGKLAAGIKKRVLRKSLRLRVGLLGTPKGRAKLFYGRIVDLGRRSQLVTVTRRKVAGSVLVRGRKVAGEPYVMRVRGFSGRRFVTGRMPDVRNLLNQRLKSVWDRVLKKAASGGNDD